MRVTVQQRRGEDERWHSIDFLRSGIVLIRANQSGKVSEKQRWVKSWQGKDGQCYGRAKQRTAMAKQGLGKHRQGFELHSNGEEMNGSDMLRKSVEMLRGDKLRRKF